MNGLVQQMSNQLNNSFGTTVDQLKDGLDVLKAGKDVVSTVVKDVTGEDVSIQSIQQGAIDFDNKWDAFANQVNEKFNNTTSANQANILETLAKSHFGNDIYNLGSALKNELPGVLGGIADYKKAIDSFSSNSKTAEEAAKKITDGVNTIVQATQNIATSLNNAVQTCTGNNIPILTTLSNIGGSSAVTNLNKVLALGTSGATIATTAKQLGDAIKGKDLKGITDSMAKGATTINDLLTQLNNTIPGFPNAQIPSQITISILQLQNGQAIYDAAGSMITALVADASGHFSIGSFSTLTTHFDQNWDTFSAKIDALFRVTPGNGQQSVLETLAKSMFGENVFYAAGAIKRQLPGVLGGITGVQDALKQFGGSYRNPIEAATKIKNGVEKMVQAVEKIGESLNNIVKYYQGKGNIANGTGYPILDTLANLGDTKGIKALDTAIRIGGGGVAVLGNAGAVAQALKNKDLKGAVSAIKKTIDDVKRLTKKGNYTSSSSGNTSTGGNKTSSTTNNGNSQQQSNPTSAAQSNSYVCSGATMRCTMGEKTAKLTVLPIRTVYLTGQPMANISDHVSMVNLAPFGKCRSLGYPATASATAAHHGVLTPMPCSHNTPMNWMPGKNDYLVKGQPALLKTSKCQCMWGGMISLTDDGQMSTGSIDMSRTKLEKFENNRQGIADSKDGTLADRFNKAKQYWKNGDGIIRSFQKANQYVNFERARNKEHFMADEDADLKKSNPNYYEKKEDREYRINCATTTITFMMRKRGYNVIAKSRHANKHTNEIAFNLNYYKSWKNSDGTDVSPTLLHEKFNTKVENNALSKELNELIEKKDDLKKTREIISKIQEKINDPFTSIGEGLELEDKLNILKGKELELKKEYFSLREIFTPIYKEVLTDVCNTEGYYTFGITWEPINQRGGHYTIIKCEKDMNGNMVLKNIEPQTGKPFENIDSLISILDYPPKIDDSIMRTDDKLFNEDYIDLFEIK